MGPQLIADKSLLQALSEKEIWCLERYYYVVYTPTLFVEILGDLKKFEGDRQASENEVLKLANKITPGETIFTCHHGRLAVSELLGRHFVIDGRPIVDCDIVKTDGRGAALIDEEPERCALRRWRERDFSQAEEALAVRYRESIRSLDFEAWRRRCNGAAKIRDLSELSLAIEQAVDSKELQYENLTLLLQELGCDNLTRNAIFERWLRVSMPKLHDYAPYAYHCLRVYVGFYLALASRLIGTGSTNRIDLEYFLYLPFCKVFTSADKFHKQLFDVFKIGKVRFVWGLDLKADLARIVCYFDRLSEQEKSDYRAACDDYPPDLDGSFTLSIWKELMGSREQHKPIKLSTDEEKKLVERVMRDFERLKREAR
jgi:hypothetical protein